jgi:hypothetical protein
VYGNHESDAPGDRIRERSSKSDDINHGMDGKCVTNVCLFTNHSGANIHLDKSGLFPSTLLGLPKLRPHSISAHKATRSVGRMTLGRARAANFDTCLRCKIRASCARL